MAPNYHDRRQRHFHHQHIPVLNGICSSIIYTSRHPVSSRYVIISFLIIVLVINNSFIIIIIIIDVQFKLVTFEIACAQTKLNSG